MGAALPFVFGRFRISEGRSAYQIVDARIDNSFAKLRDDLVGVCYGSYFMEILQYITRENSESTALLMLAYQSLRALESDVFDDRLVRAVFERQGTEYLDATRYALDFLWRTPPAKLYSFNVKPEVLTELEAYAKWLVNRTWNHSFKSLQILEVLI